MTDRQEALAKAAEWAGKAERAVRTREQNEERAASWSGNVHAYVQVAEYKHAATVAERDRQTAVEMAQMWLGIANAPTEELTP